MIDRPCQLFVLAVQTDRCAWWERRRRNEEGAWHTHDTLVATHRALCTGIRHKADERDPRLERVSETRCARLDTEENGWKSRADLRQLLVWKVQYVYNNHYFIFYIQIETFNVFSDYFHPTIEFACDRKIKEYSFLKQRKYVTFQPILLSCILFNIYIYFKIIVALSNRILFLV